MDNDEKFLISNINDKNLDDDFGDNDEKEDHTNHSHSGISHTHSYGSKKEEISIRKNSNLNEEKQDEVKEDDKEEELEEELSSLGVNKEVSDPNKKKGKLSKQEKKERDQNIKHKQGRKQSSLEDDN